MALSFAVLSCRTPVRCLEGDEPEAFWQSLGGRASYDSSLLSLEPPRQLARLFHCTMFGGRLVTEEIFNVTQAALARDDILLLDVGNEVCCIPISYASSVLSADNLRR